MKRPIAMAGAVTVGLVIVAAVVVADSGKAGGWLSFIHAVPFGDKAGHLLLAGGFSFFCNLAAGRRVHRLRPGRVSWVLLALFALEELSQWFLASRQCDAVDFACDAAGIIAGQWLASIVSGGGSRVRGG